MEIQEDILLSVSGFLASTLNTIMEPSYRVLVVGLVVADTPLRRSVWEVHELILGGDASSMREEALYTPERMIRTRVWNRGIEASRNHIGRVCRRWHTPAKVISTGRRHALGIQNSICGR